ncbi:Hypothetical protein CINCED_3A004088 [Cinara cedri]|uniref:Uncharacterized protein n=1 Tax=Cinara cedri TaxID=506608 RepID=A0A5E4NHW2_9HEMI|nr:Hypothetical protein CINCED_3A004088 [Cinara cedri]
MFQSFRFPSPVGFIKLPFSVSKPEMVRPENSPKSSTSGLISMVADSVQSVVKEVLLGSDFPSSLIKVHRKSEKQEIFGPVKYEEIAGWRIRKQQKIRGTFPESKHIKYNPEWKAENPEGKISLGQCRLRWGNVVKRDVESLNGGPDWKTKAADRETWMIGCLTGWF